jgi:hypothetical protein
MFVVNLLSDFHMGHTEYKIDTLRIENEPLYYTPPIFYCHELHKFARINNPLQFVQIKVIRVKNHFQFSIIELYNIFNSCKST